MKYRCENRNCPAFRNYGGRGITVCEEWSDVLSGYDIFKEWAMSHGYEDYLTIDRINVNDGYHPENCRWIPLPAQNLNRRNNRIIAHNGQSKTLSEWSKEYNIPIKTLHRRLSLGWDFSRAITSPVRTATSHVKQI